MVSKMSRTATGLGLSTGHIQVAKPINSDTTFPVSEQWTPLYALWFYYAFNLPLSTNGHCKIDSFIFFVILAFC